jgi:membrane-associated protease RseP (regulator of RpoE activity)
VLANGDVTARNGFYDVVIVCDGDVTLTDSHVNKSLIAARGNIKVKRGASASVLIAGGKVTLGNDPKKTGPNFSVIKENEKNPLGITFFELSTVGVEVKAADKAIQIAAVADGKPFADAGVRVGDTITEVNGKKPDSAESLSTTARV